jgi:DNA topoisomerase-1
MDMIRGNYKLVICEKPNAAKRVASILGDESIRTITTKSRIPIFDITSKNKEHYVICSALGHLYNLVPLKKNRKIYPVFDLEWSPRHSKNSKDKVRVNQIISELSEVSKRAAGYIHACDYDIEGELIGYNILELACKNKYEKSKRAKFSTLTDSDIRNSFANLLEPDMMLATAGKTRHTLDFIFGINLSRALSNSFIKYPDRKSYSNFTIGRVQGPTLSFVVQREMEINRHVPVPYWNVSAEFNKGDNVFNATYWPKTIQTYEKAIRIVDECRDKDGVTNELRAQKKSIYPPAAFNLGELQKEAFRIFKIQPNITLSVAESLYLSAFISYPRTSSQKLPTSIRYRDILTKLAKNYIEYQDNANSLLLKDKLFPTQGTKDDPAHPAIYPTGEKPNKLNSVQVKIYDLIAKRFFAAFGSVALIQNSTILFEVAGHSFTTEGRNVLDAGWIYYYKPYFRISESELPDVRKGDIVHVQKITKVKKFTKPPLRFNQATLLETMEREGIGTKSTRAEIINTLIKRRYIIQESSGLVATEIGFAVINTMTKFIHSIISTDLTRSFEEDLEGIETGKIPDRNVIAKAVDTLETAVMKIKASELLIGQELNDAVEKTGKDSSMVGVCPLCNIGNLLIIKSLKSRKRFIVCSQYRMTGCSASAPLPQTGKLIKSKYPCPICRWPIMIRIFGRNKPWKFCVNSKCESKNRCVAWKDSKSR